MRRMAELDEQYQQLAHRIQGLDVAGWWPAPITPPSTRGCRRSLPGSITLIPASGWSCGRAALLSWGSWWITGGRTSALSASGRDGTKIRRIATEHNVTLFTALDTIRVLLDVLEETTLTISTIDA